MRILNRPMFKYGGPIKEGIMHGMQNGGRIGFKDGTKKKKYDWFETPIGKIMDPRELPGEALLGGKKMIAGTYDLGGVPLNKLSQWFSGYNPGFSGAKFMGIKPDKKDTAYWMGMPTSTKEGWTIPSMKEGPTAAELELEALKKKIAAQTKGTMPENLGTKAWIDPNKATKLAKEQQGERIQKYLKMMGYDSAKKGAMSKALIDASAQVQDATTEAGSLKHADWGNLINRVIQTTSKRLEKPEQIREAVGLMATKAAIQKDMTAEEDALKTKALKLKIKESERALNPTAADLALLASGKTGKVSQATLQNMVRRIGGVENLKATFKDEKDTAYADWLDDNDKASEMKFMKDVVMKQSDFGAGFYVFPDRVIEVKDDLTMSWWH